LPRTSLITRFGATVAMTAALAFGVAACGSDDSSDSSSADTKPLAELTDLSGVDTQVTFDAGFVQALGDLKLTPGPVGDATISKDGVASFPITGGNVTYYDPTSSVRPYVQGIIDHEGSGLSLTTQGTEVDLTDFVIDPGTSELTGTVSVNGKEAATDAVLFDLDGSTLNPLKKNSDGSATLEGTTVKLSSDAASLLNETFNTDALKGGIVIGVSSITVK
jgi:hypothetical protein